MSETTIAQDPAAEIARQIDRYVELGYPALAEMSVAQFRGLGRGLADIAADAVANGLDIKVTASGVPVVVVVTSVLVPAVQRQVLTRLAGGTKPGIVDRNHGDEGLTPYAPIEGLNVPQSGMYLLLDVERGEEFCGVRPKDALPVILDRGRSPLTIDEGISLVTLFPKALEKNKCFMLAGSRRGDKRVPAMWIADKAPKLGWCWEGNPHDWLGVASAGGRRTSSGECGHGTVGT